MLDAYIIEELKRREKQRDEEHRPTLEIPLDDEPCDRSEENGEEDDDGDDNGERDPKRRGVIIIDFNE